MKSNKKNPYVLADILHEVFISAIDDFTETDFTNFMAECFSELKYDAKEKTVVKIVEMLEDKMRKKYSHNWVSEPSDSVIFHRCTNCDKIKEVGSGQCESIDQLVNFKIH